MTALDALKQRLLEVDDLSQAAALLRSDQTTYMPSQGAPARGRQLATLSRLAHEKFTDAETGRLLDAAAKETASLPFESDEASLVRVTRRNWEQSVKIPTALVAEFQEHCAKSYQAWTEAKPKNDFATVRPLLEKTLDLSRRMADCFPGYQHIADPLIDFSDFGMKAASVKRCSASCARSWCRSCARSRRGRWPTNRASGSTPRGGPARVRRRGDPSASATTSRAAGWTRPITRS
jgi:carboxypeptidase Taq